MKKVVLLLLVISTFATTRAQIQFGAKAGLNLSTFTGSGIQGAKLNPGFHAGGLVAIPFGDKFSIQPELLYSLQGAKGSDENGSWTDNVSYLNVPVLVKRNIISGLFVETGPQLGILLSAKQKVDKTSTDFKNSLNTIDFSLAFGLGFQASSNIGIDARYNLGLTNIAKNSGSSAVHNNVIQVGVFYLFGENKNSK